MDIKRLNLIYFSPTQSTKKIVYSIAKGADIKVPTRQVNLTSRSEREKEYIFGPDDLLIVGTPSYGGRLPQLDPPLFENFKGNNTPVIFAAVYGNIGYGDILLELKNMFDEKGFFCVAGGAFVAQHAASTKIGSGRPNEDDLKEMARFGALVVEKLNDPERMSIPPSLPGNFPYKLLPPSPPLSPVANSNCIYCMLCYMWCPMDAIPYYSPNETDVNKCIRCQGCVRRCPVSGREIDNETYRQRVSGLEEKNCENECKPEVFL